MSVISTKLAKHYKWGEQCNGWHLVQSKNLSVIQEQMPAGAAEQMHFHNQSEQFFYILSGVATIEIDGKEFLLEAGEGTHIIPKVQHKLSNQHLSELIFLVISTPPSHGDRQNI